MAGRFGNDRALGRESNYAASSSSFCCNHWFTNVSIFTPRLAACFSISLSNSSWTGTVLITSNSASGASVSNSVKSWVSQNSPILSSESALEMLLNLFSSIGLAFFVAHVASTDDDCGLACGLVNEEDRKVSTAQRLSKCRVYIFADGVAFLYETDTRTTNRQAIALIKEHARHETRRDL